MAKWVQSYRDLPLLLNQWANVVRWELRPRVFLRTSEFLWQEGHTAHATQADAAAYARRILEEVYRDVMVEVLAIPVYVGRKIAEERFAGAINTLACEAMMRDGKALQMGTSHELGQNFARAFDIGFLDGDGVQQLCWTTSWGVSTRMMGGLIMAHGDDRGLRVPPRVAAVQVVVVVVRDDDGAVAEAARRMVAELDATGVRARLDDRVEVAFGRRATDWELKGVPVRVELGPRDLAEGRVVVVRRDQEPGAETAKRPVALAAAAAEVAALLEHVQADMLAAATQERDVRTVEVAHVEEAVEAAEDGFARIPWSALCGGGVAALGEHAVTVRCLQSPAGEVPEAEDDRDVSALVARAY
jgi:prolyl-tRNA synthetase